MFLYCIGKEVDEVAKVSMASGILLTEYEIVTEAEPNYQLPSEKERLVKAMGLNLY